MAEKNYREYGWPIPSHLQASVAAIAPDLQHTFTSSSKTSAHAPTATETPADKQHSQRLAAGRGKLEEVDLGPEAAARIEQAWKRLETGEPELSASRARRDRYGYAWRKPRGGKTDEDKKRDQMVEAVLSEAKRMYPPCHVLLQNVLLTRPFVPVDYFDAPAPSKPPVPNSTHANADDALVEQFRTEYFESIEARHQRHAARKPATSAAKGAAPTISGPKMGGSKSARARMHKLQQEELAKKKMKQ